MRNWLEAGAPEDWVCGCRNKEQNCGRDHGMNVFEGGKSRCGAEGGLLRGKRRKCAKRLGT